MDNRSRTSRSFIVIDEKRDISFWEEYSGRDKLSAMLVCDYEPDANSKKKHYLAFLYFENNRTGGAVSKDVNPRNIMIPTKMSPRDCWDYLLGAGEILGGKELLSFGEPKGQGCRTDLNDLYDSIKKREITSLRQIAEISPTLYARHKNALKDFLDMYNPPRTWKTEVIVFWGEGGRGKTTEVYRLDPGVEEVKISGDRNNPFVLNYTGAKDAVLMDDFNYASVDPTWFLNITDRFPCTVNVKHGSTNWNPKKLYFTSNVHPSKWWSDGSEWASTQIKRRFTRIVEVDTLELFDDMDPIEEKLTKKNPLDKEGVVTKVKRDIHVGSGATNNTTSYHTKDGRKKLQMQKEDACDNESYLTDNFLRAADSDRAFVSKIGDTVICLDDPDTFKRDPSDKNMYIFKSYPYFRYDVTNPPIMKINKK